MVRHHRPQDLVFLTRDTCSPVLTRHGTRRSPPARGVEVQDLRNIKNPVLRSSPTPTYCGRRETLTPPFSTAHPDFSYRRERKGEGRKGGSTPTDPRGPVSLHTRRSPSPYLPHGPWEDPPMPPGTSRRPPPAPLGHCACTPTTPS